MQKAQVLCLFSKRSLKSFDYVKYVYTRLSLVQRFLELQVSKGLTSGINRALGLDLNPNFSYNYIGNDLYPVQ